MIISILLKPTKTQQLTNYFHENAQQNLRQHKMEGEFIFFLLKEEAVRL